MKKLMILSALAIFGIASFLYANQNAGASTSQEDCPAGCCKQETCCVK